jgi:hypothetical protein
MTETHGDTAALFVSYAHNDDEPLVPGQPGWVQTFQRALRVRLKHLLGREPDLWWDLATLRGNEVIGTAIERGLGQSSVLVTIISPSYVDFERSDWCRKELEGFCSAVRERAGTSDVRHRIFKVVKTFVTPDRQPDVLRDLRGYEFYLKDPVDGRLREFFLQASAPVDPKYFEKIDDLADDIRKLLKEEPPVAAAATAGATAATAPVIYLAETTFDLTSERDQLARMLRQAGHHVLPDRELPVGQGERLREYVRECLLKSALSIHLLGANYGVIPEGERESVSAIQNQLASERSGDTAFCRLIWTPPNLVTDDERQKAFLERLRTDSAAQLGAEILHGGLTEIEALVRRRLEGRPDAAPKKGPPAPDANLKVVYLLCDHRDRDAAERLRDVLYSALPAVEVWLPPTEGDEAEVRALHRDYLTQCDGALIYYGQATEAWVLAKLSELRKISGYGREKPLASRAIYMAPPSNTAKQRFRSREAEVLTAGETPELGVLSSFLAQLGFERTA